ncbi:MULTISPECIES: circadian clock KaiB family protein [unclassified Thioalkalivibrio]|uniref:circadian clock KaiB family protein n=1 Tax=unclassified Thioalkalivibrio TaxID=2621013 RepID=UPI00036E495B|nr:MULTISPECIES: circadian clock KaiB family protein [unclassified Thioalkalivibrio]PYG03887.1 circadian clock protein KaiB [Thioalkalivibrio sp. ALE21]
MNNETRDCGEASIPVLTLFVTGSAPRSQRARANLARMLEQLGRADLRPREVDLLEQPLQGITQSVFATPSLLKTDTNGEVSVLYGDLAEEEQLRRFLAELETDT